MSVLAAAGELRTGSVRRAGPADISEIAAIHVQAFPKSFLSELGPPFLKVYYRLVWSDPGGIVLVHENSGEIDGFAAGFLRPDQFYRRMKDARWSMLGCLIGAVVKRPWLARRIFYHVRRIMLGKRRTHPGECELSSIGVRPDRRGRGMGKALARKFLEAAWNGGVACVGLTTDAHENDGVNLLYQGLGFELRECFEQYGGRMMNDYVFRRSGL